LPLFSKRPDAMSRTIKLVEAYSSSDQSMIELARRELAPVSTMEILQSLYSLGQLLGKATLTPEQTATLAQELEVAADSPEMTAAVQNIGRAILMERSQPAFVDAVNKYGEPLLGSTSDQLRRMTLLLCAVIGSACRRLEVNFRWK
jgi:hypothetical protein